jgi:hypothetical protein
LGANGVRGALVMDTKTIGYITLFGVVNEIVIEDDKVTVKETARKNDFC